MNNSQQYMQLALAEAAKAATLGEVPIGAVIVVNDQVIASAHNQVETLKDATAHAELLAIRQASSQLGNWRLTDASLFVTLEPCSMCIGALVLSRVTSLYFGAADPRQGAVGSLFDLSNFPGLPHHVQVYPDLMADESRRLLEDFFRKQRLKSCSE